MKVRNSQIQMFGDSYDPEQVSLEIKRGSQAAGALDLDTQGPPIILPERDGLQVDQMINEVVLTPMLDRKNQYRSGCSNEDFEKRQMSLWQ